MTTRKRLQPFIDPEVLSALQLLTHSPPGVQKEEEEETYIYAQSIRNVSVVLIFFLSLSIQERILGKFLFFIKLIKGT